MAKVRVSCYKRFSQKSGETVVLDWLPSHFNYTSTDGGTDNTMPLREACELVDYWNQQHSDFRYWIPPIALVGG